MNGAFGIGRRTLLVGALLLGVARTAAAQAPAHPEQLRIGFQKSSADLLVLKQHHVLEGRFADTRISWIEFPAGPQLLEALSAGGIDVGMTGDTPPVFAQAASRDLVYIGAEEPKPLSSAILVRGDSRLRTLADLKGKRIALQKGSSAHYLLVRAVAKAGLAWSQIEPIYLAPADARAAFERGSVDAWAIWDPYYAAAEIAAPAAVPTRVLATGEGLSSNNTFYLASRPYAENHPRVIAALLEELTKSDAWIGVHRAEAARLVADYAGLDVAVAQRFLDRRTTSVVRPLSPAVVEDQQRVADAFRALGLIPQPVRVAAIVWQAPTNVAGLKPSSTTGPKP